jgi:hypothetical protein
MLRKMFISLAGVIAVMAALIFFPAGTLDYWQAWQFLACYFLASLLLSLWLVRHDPALLARRAFRGRRAPPEDHHDDHVARVRCPSRRPRARSALRLVGHAGAGRDCR